MPNGMEMSKMIQNLYDKEKPKLKTFRFSLRVECVQSFEIKAKSEESARRLIKKNIKTYESVNASGDINEIDYSISDGVTDSIDNIEDWEEIKEVSQ